MRPETAGISLILFICIFSQTGCGSSENKQDENDTDAGIQADAGNNPDSGSSHDAYVPGKECDMLTQDCSAGLKCSGIKDYFNDPYSGTKCVPDNADGGAPVGMICINMTDGRDTCGPDSMCIQFGTGEGACYEHCGLEHGEWECPEGFNCASINSEFDIRLCFQDCNPLIQDCPYETRIYGCYPDSGEFSCLSWRPYGIGVYADECIENINCSPGHWCAQKQNVPGCSSEHGCCSIICDTSEPDTCPDAAKGQECVPFYEQGQAPPGKSNTGLCKIN